jgi:hypothetical protein
MDPTATWHAIVEGLQQLARNPHDSHTREELVWALRDLATWLDHGGFPPDLAVTTPRTGPTPAASA